MSPAEKAARQKQAAGANKLPWGSRRAARRSVVFPASRLRALRAALGLTQRDVSVGSGVNNATVADAEAGFEMTLTNALKLAKFFGKPVEELWPLK